MRQVRPDRPTSDESVANAFEQLVKANDPLRTGLSCKTVTFALSTTQPWPTGRRT